MLFCLSLKIMSSCLILSKTLIIAIYLMIYGIFFTQRRIKRHYLYQLLLLCHMDIILGHIMFLNLLRRDIITLNQFEYCRIWLKISRFSIDTQ